MDIRVNLLMTILNRTMNVIQLIFYRSLCLATLAEEEALMNEKEDVTDELRLLNEENEMSVEELRRRYYGAPSEPEPTLPSDLSDQPCSSTLPILVATDPLKKLFGDNVLDSSEDEDEDFVPKATEYWKKEVRIGENYQVFFACIFNFCLGVLFTRFDRKLQADT